MARDALLDELRELSRRFAEREAADAERYPAENIADLQRAGLLNAPFPREFGGRAAALPEMVQATEAVAAASASTALLLAMPLGLAGSYGLGPDAAPAEHRSAWGDQIERVAGEYRAGAIYAACNSEKGAGGSLANTKTSAARGEDGGFRLSGEKILASFGEHADIFFSTAKVSPTALPGAGIVEFFLVPADGVGVEILDDWDGFGMRSTESQSVRFLDAPARELMGFPNFIEIVQPSNCWSCHFAAIPLGCVRAMLQGLATPAPESPALRLRCNEALMRYEALRAYLLETASQWRAGADPAYTARVLRMKTYVTQEATKLCAELFALSGGRHYRRGDALARALADSFAATALRPPLSLALETLSQSFSFDAIG